MGNYVVQYIRSATTCKDLVPPDKTLMNGYGTRPEVWDALESLALAHKQGGIEGAKAAWDNTLSKLIPDITEKVNKPRYLYHADELKMLPPIRWLVDGEIPERGLTVLFGPPKSGKSFLAVDYAERVAVRRPVVYIAAEGDSGYQYRHEAWKSHHKFKETNKLYFWRHPVQMMRPNDVREFIEEVKDIKPQLVIVDTLSRCMSGGDENMQKDMSTFIESVDTIREQLHTAVLVLHHTNKSGDMRGSTVLAGAAESVLELTNNEGSIKVTQTMCKDGKTIEPRLLRLMEVGIEPGITSCVLLPQSMVLENPNELTPNQSTLIGVLCDLYDRGARTSDLKGACNFGNTTFYEVLKSLSKRGIIDKEGRYDPWVLTQYGKQLAVKHGFIKRAA